MSELTLAEATENIYLALKDGNRDIDLHIAAMKGVLAREGRKEAEFEPKKLAYNNRSGRKSMQAYFRQRGVTVVFSEG